MACPNDSDPLLQGEQRNCSGLLEEEGATTCGVSVWSSELQAPLSPAHTHTHPGHPLPLGPFLPRLVASLALLALSQVSKLRPQGTARLLVWTVLSTGA